MDELKEFDLSGEDIKSLTHAQMVDLATTVEAVERFAHGNQWPKYEAVSELASQLLVALAGLGARPQGRE